MSSIRFNLSALRLVRFLVAVCVCALLVFSNAFPAYSDPVNITGNKAAPEKGQEKLLGIEKGAQELTQEKPLSREETQARAKEGTNEVQGGADLGKMYRPENSQGAISVEDKSKNFLDKLTGK